MAESWEITWSDGVIAPFVLSCELVSVQKKDLIGRNIEGLTYQKSHSPAGRIQAATFRIHRIHFTHAIRNQFNTWHDSASLITATFTDTTSPYLSFTGRLASVDPETLLDGHLGWGPWKLVLIVESYTSPP